MSTNNGEPEIVNGLVDNRRAANILGISVDTFRVWAARSKVSTGGITASMPQPVATMHGKVYRAEEIEAFGRRIASSSKAPKTEQRSRGAYFTPDVATEMMIRWALRSESDVVVEPSLGDGQFARAAQSYAREHDWESIELHGCELDAASARAAVASGAVASDRVHVGDFLGLKDLPSADVVIGNPPYVRLRELDTVGRKNAQDASLEALGETVDQAGSIWVPFVARSAHMLRAGGRLALVLPLDFTYVAYARPLWRYLADSFSELTVLRYRARVFPNIMQNVLILLADGKGGATDVINFGAHPELTEDPHTHVATTSIDVADVLSGERAFQHALLPDSTKNAYASLLARTTRADERLKFNIGYVAGNKKFFHPTAEQIEKFDLPESSLYTSVAASRQFSRQGAATSRMPASTHLWIPGETLSEGEQQYVEFGESQGVDMAYKCRIRTPWYKVPGVKVPDVILTTFSDQPRLHLNDAGWVASNSVLAGFMKNGNSSSTFLNSWYTPLTMLSTELQVHSLGGGVMIAVPREADSIRILNSDSTKSLDPAGLDAALQSSDATAPYRHGTGAITRLIGADGAAAIIEGAETLQRWRKSQQD